MTSRGIGGDSVHREGPGERLGKFACAVTGAATEVENPLMGFGFCDLDRVGVCGPVSHDVHGEEGTFLVESFAGENELAHSVLSSEAC